MDSSTEENFDPEDISDPCNYLLVQQSLTDFHWTLLAESAKEFFRGEVLPKWIGSQVSP